MHIKTLFTSLLLLCVSICTRAQFFENNYLSINIPEGWEINKQNMAAIDAEIVVFVNTGEEIYNIGMVMGMDRYMDAKSAIDYAQFSDLMTYMFQDVKIHESRASKFMGHSAYTKDFDAKLDGAPFKGALYTFDLGNSFNSRTLCRSLLYWGRSFRRSFCCRSFRCGRATDLGGFASTCKFAL